MVIVIVVPGSLTLWSEWLWCEWLLWYDVVVVRVAVTVMALGVVSSW